jgi:tetratricopeptide (TPR) repeat protein
MIEKGENGYQFDQNWSWIATDWRACLKAALPWTVLSEKDHFNLLDASMRFFPYAENAHLVKSVWVALYLFKRLYKKANCFKDRGIGALNIGSLYMIRWKDLKKTEDWYRSVLEEGPHPMVLHSLAGMYVHQNRYEEAIEVATEALSFGYDRWDETVKLGQSASEAKHQMENSMATVYGLRAIAYRMCGKDDLARDDIMHMLRVRVIDPSNLSIYNSGPFPDISNRDVMSMLVVLKMARYNSTLDFYFPVWEPLPIPKESLRDAVEADPSLKQAVEEQHGPIYD